MTTGILTSPNRLWICNSTRVRNPQFLSVSSTNTFAHRILKVTDNRHDVILARGLHHRFPWAILHVFESLFLISWEDNRDCHITMPLSLKKKEVQIKEDQWNKMFRAVQVYWFPWRHLPNPSGPSPSGFPVGAWPGYLVFARSRDAIKTVWTSTVFCLLQIKNMRTL